MRGTAWVLFGLFALTPCAAGGPGEAWKKSRQALVGVTKTANDSRVTLRWYEKRRGQWEQVGVAWPGRIGVKGLAWGSGLHPASPAGAMVKKEGDKRAPSGVFLLGDIYGLIPSDQVPRRPSMTYHRITTRDLWVEDVNSKYYNQHLRLPYEEPRTAWEKKQQMRMKDPAHVLKVFVAHNAPPHAVPGVGSAIFLHIWRENGARATTGCTTMPEVKLRELIARMDPAAKPLYILMSQDDYKKRRSAWKLP